jgi:hypothetical protein
MVDEHGTPGNGTIGNRLIQIGTHPGEIRVCRDRSHGNKEQEKGDEKAVHELGLAVNNNNTTGLM